jgi:L-asparaginase
MRTVVILGTGGTIAGTNDDPARAWHYKAAQLSVAQLLDAAPRLQGLPVETRQLAQIDSKDMRWSVWQSLAHEMRSQLERADVAGVVITHGTDTLEETAYLLHRLSDGRKPVVLTAAMRPATAPDADGPANLRDAVRVVQEADSRQMGGVWVVVHGRVWAGDEVRKSHSTEVDAFDAGGRTPLALIDAQQGQWSEVAEASRWARSGDLGWAVLDQHPPRVEILLSHADADGWLVDAALQHGSRAAPLQGLVVACTGHGTIHEDMMRALTRAETAGVTIWRSTRVGRGGVSGREGDIWRACGDLTPAQARVALMLHLLVGR